MDKPPPSYQEAIASPGPPDGRLSSVDGNSPSIDTPPPPPNRPSHLTTPHSQPPPHPPRPTTLNHHHQPSDLYTANQNLPWRYPSGVFCKKCKNSGFKTSNGKYCASCWDQYYLHNHAYNPNGKLPFQYPKRFYCEKCNNTGIKVKNGKTCKDCYERFARRTRPNVSISSSSPFDLFGSTTTTTIYSPPPPPPPPQPPYHGYGPPGPPPGPPGPPGPAPYAPYAPPGGYAPSGGYSPMPPLHMTPIRDPSVPPMTPIRVRPGDPRLGGVLCGRCRGSGLVYFFLDQDLCPVCNGTGRIFGN